MAIIFASPAKVFGETIHSIISITQVIVETTGKKRKQNANNLINLQDIL